MFPHDLRYTLRLLRRSPGFAAVAVLSLALGIGANTAIFSLFYTILLRSLPVAHPEQLVEFLQNEPGQPRFSHYWAWDTYEFFRDNNHVFSDLTGMSFDNLAAVHLEKSQTETVVQENVLGNYFSVLGLKPARGRFIAPEDVSLAGSGDVAVVSWSYWDSRCHGDPAILGKRLFVGDELKTIIGVAPRGYTGPRVGVRTDIWVPQERKNFTMLARLKPGGTVRQAQAEMAVLYQQVLDRQASKNKHRRGVTIQVEPAAAGLVHVRDQYGKPLLLLMGVVGLLLLLACVNLTSMLLARAASRQREFAVRVGLGASRMRLVSQMLTETIVLSLTGLLAGTFFAYGLCQVLIRMLASSRAFERVELQVQPDPSLLCFSAGVALLSGVLLGLAPAWHAFHLSPADDLRQSGTGGVRPFWQRFGRALVTAQIALSIFLVAAAAVFLHHLSRLRNFDLGFQRDHVLLLAIDQTGGYKPEVLAAHYRQILSRLETIPGVRSASSSGCAPLEGCGTPGRYMFAEGHTERAQDRHRSGVTFVTPRYFQTLGIPLIAGRDFTFDDAKRSRVAIINRAMARRYFPASDPVGKHITVDRNSTPGWFGSDQPYEIVGVVGDVKAIEIRDVGIPTVYFDMFQENQLMNHFEVRTLRQPEATARTVEQIVLDVLKASRVMSVTTLSDQVDANIVPERLIATLSKYFGMLGAVLAGVGLYGLQAYTVAHRTNEVGIRMALGATPNGICRLILQDALLMVCAGVLAGAALVLLSRPLIEHLMPDLEPGRVLPLIYSAILMVLVTLIATYVPLRRAIRIDPMAALRHD